ETAHDTAVSWPVSVHFPAFSLFLGPLCAPLLFSLLEWNPKLPKIDSKPSNVLPFLLVADEHTFNTKSHNQVTKSTQVTILYYKNKWGMGQNGI
ncbi:hypothetical protein ABN226_18565, partial [Morganella morganii]|uniref:hypothetical protein n=1 Tax=Morganella morganii TaxID=582 RepID=UPI0032DA611F